MLFKRKKMQKNTQLFPRAGNQRGNELSQRNRASLCNYALYWKCSIIVKLENSAAKQACM